MIDRFKVLSMLRGKIDISEKDIEKILKAEQHELAEGIIEYLMLAKSGKL